MVLLGDAIHVAVLLAEEYDRTKKVKKVIPGQYELNFDTNALNENAGYPFEVPEVKKDSKKVPLFEACDEKLLSKGMIDLPEEKEVSYQSPVLKNQVLLAALKKLNRIGIWEAEIVRLPLPAQMEPDEAPVFPAMIMMVSRKNEYMLPAIISDARNDDFSELLSNFAEAWKTEDQLPRKIMARDERTKCFLGNICEKLGISVSVAQEKLPSLDEAQALMLNEFGNGAYTQQ